VWSRRARAAFARPSLLIALIVALVPICILILEPAPRATAVTNAITVNTLDDPGTSSECSLRAAINNANNKSSDSNSTCAAGTGNDTIVFSVSGTITLGSTLPAIANASGGSLTIDGTGEAVTVHAAGQYRVVVVNPGATLSLSGLTITGNTSFYGGGVSPMEVL